MSIQKTGGAVINLCGLCVKKGHAKTAKVNSLKGELRDCYVQQLPACRQTSRTSNDKDNYQSFLLG